MTVLDELLTEALNRGASDVHLVPGLKPVFRIHTALEAMEHYETVTPEMTERFVLQMAGEARMKKLREQQDADFSAELKGLGRFRVNAHYQRDVIAVAFRAIPQDVPELESLHLPSAIEKFVDFPRGLILLTGPTGSGKSTTLAAMIQTMNKRHAHHILTIEDPVEYELISDKCVIEQRELGQDVPTFASGLKHALRQDPDIILLGEMRDLDTTSAAITAAETGHLVLSTLHTQGAAQTLERIIDIYPGAQQNQIRSMLSNTLQAVVTQTLFKRQDRKGMIPACEVMICTPAVRNCIRENRIHEIPNIIETNRAIGMCTMDESIKVLCLNGYITPEQAMGRAVHPKALHRALCA